MRLFNVDVEEAERNYSPSIDDEAEFEEELESDPCRSFFDLRQRTLTGMDQMSAFRLVALGAVRKLRTNLKGSILYGEVEDALGRYFRLLDADMQKFATLHETLRDAADKQDPKAVASKAAFGSNKPPAAVKEALSQAHAILLDAMREIAVVLLACGEMQRRALDLKVTAQRSIAETHEGVPPLVSFSKFADFLEEALAVCDQLRRKHEDLHQQRMRAMASAAEARSAAAAQAPQPVRPPFSPPPRNTAEGQRQAAMQAAAAEAAQAAQQAAAAPAPAPPLPASTPAPAAAATAH